MSLFIDQHEFIHSFVFLRRDLVNFNNAESTVARSRARKCVDLVFCLSDCGQKAPQQSYPGAEEMDLKASNNKGFQGTFGQRSDM